MSESMFSPENRVEREPKTRTVITDFLRHGESAYQEVLMSDEERQQLGDTRPIDLTEKGIEQVRKTAEELAQRIDKENEIVVLWSSPAWRARGSEEIIREVFEREGIEVLREDIVSSMRPMKQHDAEHMLGVWAKAKQEGRSGDAVVARDPEFQQPSDKFESYPEIKRRAERVYNWIRYIAEKIDTKGKKLHIIGTSHFEFMNPVMEELFGFDVEKEEGVAKGEPMRVVFDYEPETGEMKISADFRGQHKEGLTFDKKERRFVSQ